MDFSYAFRDCIKILIVNPELPPTPKLIAWLLSLHLILVPGIGAPLFFVPLPISVSPSLPLRITSPHLSLSLIFSLCLSPLPLPLSVFCLSLLFSPSPPLSASTTFLRLCPPPPSLSSLYACLYPSQFLSPSPISLLTSALSAFSSRGMECVKRGVWPWPGASAGPSVFFPAHQKVVGSIHPSQSTYGRQTINVFLSH